MEKEFLRYILSTLFPVIVLGIGWLVLKRVRKWEASKKGEDISQKTTDENNSSQ